MSFFLCRLTDPAPTEGFSDYSDLIAWGETFPSNYLCVCLGLLGVSFTPRTVGTALARYLGTELAPGKGSGSLGGTHTAAPTLWPGLQDKPCRVDAACSCAPACCMPRGALERLDPLTHPPFGTGSMGSTGSAGSQASPRWPRRSLVAEEVLGSHLCYTGVQPG